jgi:tetratricopeptide (TPR) repeat protein
MLSPIQALRWSTLRRFETFARFYIAFENLFTGMSPFRVRTPGGFLLVTLALLGLSVPCSSQWLGSPSSEAHTHRGIDYVYNLSFDSARAEFQQVVNEQPQHPAGYFFLAMVDWWKIVCDIDNTAHDERFLSELDRVIDLCDKRLDENENDVAALFFKGGALGFRGRLHGNREDWVKAANDGRTALPIIRKAYALAPNNDDVLLGIGIYNYYAEIVPEQYPFVKPLMIFFPKGDKNKGIRQLRQASEQAAYANVEATYFLMQLFQNYEKQYGEALQFALKLHKRYPDNVLFHKYVGRGYAAIGNWPQMKTIFSDISERVKENRTGYNSTVEREAQYFLGLCDMNDANYDAALGHLYRADELSRGVDRREQSGFMVMINLKIGLIYDMQKKRDLAVSQYNKVLKMSDYQDAHKQAEQYLKQPYGKF